MEPVEDQYTQWDSDRGRWERDPYLWIYIKYGACAHLLHLQHCVTRGHVDGTVSGRPHPAAWVRREDRSADHHSSRIFRHAAHHVGQHAQGWDYYTTPE